MDRARLSGETRGGAVGLRRVVRGAGGPAVLVGLVALFAFTPLRWPCPMATVLGVPCPTCGMTRATRLALHGEFAGATRMHPLWFVVLAALALGLLVEVVGFARTGAWGGAVTHRWTARALPVIALLLAIAWVARFLGAFGGPVAV